jgi:Amt family ammonium transporter
MNWTGNQKAVMLGLKKLRSNFIFLFALSLLLCTAMPSFSQDPSGTSTGTIKDLGIDTLPASKDTTLNAVVTTVNTIGNADGHNKIAINLIWT